MKRIEKEIVTKTTKTVYESFDGMHFDSAEECEKYEGKAENVITMRFMAIAKEVPQSDVTYDALDAVINDEREICDYYIVKTESDSDVSVVLSFMNLTSAYFDETENRTGKSLAVNEIKVGGTYVVAVDEECGWSEIYSLEKIRKWFDGEFGIIEKAINGEEN